MMKETGTNSKKFIWRQRIGFGISDYACNLAYLMVNTYLLIFYTDVAGIPAASAAFMFLITKFIDAFTDYMVGALVDRTNTKMGRNRPWMLAGAPVLAVGMVLVFTTPDFSTGGKLAWAYITYIIFSFGYTLVNIPMGSILPTLSADATERTKIATTRTIFSNLGSLIIWIGGSNVAIVFLGVGLMGFGMGFRSNMYFSMLADVADYGEWQSGRNLAGTQMAVNGFSNKVSSACASAIVAGLLAWGAYDGTVAVQSSKANMAILFAFVILPIIANIVSIVVMYFYDLDKQYDQMERELKERRKKLAEQTAE